MFDLIEIEEKKIAAWMSEIFGALMYDGWTSSSTN